MPDDARRYDLPQQDGRFDLSKIDLRSLSPEQWVELKAQIFHRARRDRDRAIVSTLSSVWKGFLRLLQRQLRAAWISRVRKRREQIAAAQLRGLSDQWLADMGLTRGEIGNVVRFRVRDGSRKLH